MEREELRQALDDEIQSLNEREKKLSILNSSFKSFSEKEIDSLVERCEYRIGNLENAYAHASVANQDEIEKNIDDLNYSLASLKNEILDSENNKKNISNSFDDEVFDKIASSLRDLIDRQLEAGDAVIRKANAIINHDFETLNAEKAKESKKDDHKILEFDRTRKVNEEKVSEPVINPMEIKTDSLSQILSELDNDMKDNKDNKKELEETAKSLDEGKEIPVTNVESISTPSISPVLMSQDSINSINQSNEEVVKVSNTTVDDEPQKVIAVLNFGEEQEIKGPTLGRRAN
ncbi:MAG: hypothetical protein IJ572_04055 [Bacilli bacterium]|nr:hypothetical protein [Bacilli bacterium]